MVHVRSYNYCYYAHDALPTWLQDQDVLSNCNFPLTEGVDQLVLKLASSHLPVNATCASILPKVHLESYGVKSLALRHRNAPLSFTQTQIRPKNSKFYGPNPEPTQFITDYQIYLPDGQHTIKIASSLGMQNLHNTYL